MEIRKYIKKIQNPTFVESVLNQSFFSMGWVCHNGSLYPGKIVYHYKCGWKGGGFFGMFREVLGALNYADQFGMYPVIEWSRSVPYCDKSMDAVTRNPFEYYFQQPVNISLTDLSNVSNLVEAKPKDELFERSNFGCYERGYAWDCKRFEELAMIMQKYIRLTDEVKERIATDLRRMEITERTLGVQVRRISFQNGVKNHPVPVELDDFIAAVAKLMATGKYDKIFLATEEEESLIAMMNRFGEKIVYYKDVIRNNTGDIELSVISNRQRHHFLMGYEVLRDVCALAKCKSLVAGLSNVSINAKIMKLALDSDYSEEVILNNGLVGKGISTKQSVKKIRRMAKRQEQEMWEDRHELY